MKEIKVTRDFFLWSMSVIYLTAFSSLYHQIPGLYGDNGILPARAVIPLEADVYVVRMKVRDTPTLLWLAPALGIDVPLMMDMLALLGLIMSFGCMVWGRMRDITNYTLLWMLYFSLFQVGQTFMQFHWDHLLLEAGFLTILVAPLGFLQKVHAGRLPSLPHRPNDTITLWLVRWLLFRFMFACGVNKLADTKSAFWSLTAANHHFESQSMPTPLAWYAHHIPEWLLKLGVVGIFVIELATPLLFFIPIRSLRIFSYCCQVLLEIVIILIGNSNYLNLLILTLCITLVDDDFLLSLVGLPSTSPKNTSGRSSLRYARYIVTKVIEIVALCGTVYWTTYFFSLKFKPDWSIDSKIAFTPSQFQKTVSDILPVTIVIAVISLAANILLAFYRSINEIGGFRKCFALLSTFFISCAAVFLFIISLVPYTSLDAKTKNNLWPIIHEWHANVDQYKIANIYNIENMVVADERSELVIEGSNSLTAGWKEYHFLHKPGDVAKRPHYLIPYQPRLDVQMWVAALSTYEENPWFVSFMYRLLEGRKEVIELLDKERLPFAANRPPKFIRAILYKYSYTSLSKRPITDWWVRRRINEYFNSSSLEGNQMEEFLKAAGIPLERTRYLRVTNLFLKKALLKVRYYAETVAATTFVWSILGTGLSISFLAPVLRFR